MKKRVIIVLLILIIVVVACFIGRKLFNNNDYIKVKNGLAYNYFLGKDGKLIVNVKNNTDNDVFGVRVIITYLTNGNELGKSVKDIYRIEKGSEYSFGTDSFINDKSKIKKKNVKVSIETDIVNLETLSNSNAEIKKEDNRFIVKNKYDKDIDISFDVVYYKEGREVSAKDGFMFIKKDAEVAFSLEKSYDSEENEIEFDDYKISYCSFDDEALN